MKTALLALGLLAHLSLAATDWPQWLGPHRNGATAEPVGVHWPDTGPRRVWTLPLGTGFSGPVVAGDRVVVHHRRGDEEIVECLDVHTGAVRWRQSAPATYRDDFGFDPGPRATPTLDHGRVYTFGAAGRLSCLDLAEGRLLWTVDVAKTFNAEKGFFGFACSPLVIGDLVLLNVGGQPDAGIVAFEAATGRTRWRSTGDEAGYAAPVLLAGPGPARALCFTREGLVVLDPADGQVQVRHRWRSRQSASVNAASPLVIEGRVFLTSSYQTGAVLLDLTGPAAREVWSGDDQLSSHYASVVHRDGLLFGFHGRQEQGPALRCIDAATGKVHWSQDRLGAGTVTLAKDRLLVLTEKGELIVAATRPEGFRSLARAQVLGSGTRASPALADGHLFTRDTKELVCLDVRATP